MRILSLDQASRCTGYAVYDGTDLIKWGLIDLHKEKDVEIRYDQMCNEIYALIKRYKPNLVVFEDVSLRTSIKTLIVLARLQGAIISMATLNNAKYHIYAPTQWRSILNIKQGNKIKRPQLKPEAIDYVKQCYGITEINDDEAEGLCIGLAYLKEHNMLPEESSKKGESNYGKN